MSCMAMQAAKPQVNRADEVLLTIDNQPVTLGEFEYLYHKNNAQQLVPQTIEEYLDMFVNYKLKVAEAQAAGMDTTAAFRTELAGYARELAAPYLYDTEYENQLIDEVYNRMGENVEVSHIMVYTGSTPAERAANSARLDSIRTLIVNGADFKQLAHDYTVDRSTVDRGGYMGFIAPNQYPYQFEDAAYATEPGSVSPVIETPFGFHIVKVHSRRPSAGYVTARHIMKMTQGMPDEMKARKRAEIDSIHALLLAGADFAEVAKAESEDPGSAPQGGMLPEFTTGMMVQPFEETAFALENGAISDVIESPYGYHIINRLGWRQVEDRASAEAKIKRLFARDGRDALPRKNRIEELKKRYSVVINRPAVAMVESVIKNNGGFNEDAIASLGSMPAPLATFDGGAVILTDVIAGLAPMGDLSPEAAFGIFSDRLNAMIDEAVIDKAVAELPATNADYRNLFNEYRDGILLFEISDRNVWSRAKEDIAGLDNWFETHRDRYTWEKPKFKSYIIFATSDSVLNRVNDYLDTHNVSGKTLAGSLKTLCGKEVRVERVIAAQGENAIIDYLGFGGEKPAPVGKWVAYRAFEPEIIDAPREVADERGAITADYQASLEEQWVKDMHKRHKVKINKKVLKKVL